MTRIKSGLSEKSFVDQLSDLKVIRPGDSILVALSGGLDSITLLYLSLALPQKDNIDVYACHVNHHLRAMASRDQLFVEELCEEWKVTLEVCYVFPDSRRKGESDEMWGHRVRYAALEETRKKFNCQWILTAHHGNDQVETILQHLNLGCGIEGLRGIPPHSGNVIRPLLMFSKSDLRAFANQYRLPCVHDESNQDCNIQRNYIRHKIIRRWEEDVPDLIARFLALSRKAKSAVDYMIQAVERLAESIVVPNQKSFHIPREAVEPFSTEITIRLVKYLIGAQLKPWRRHQWQTLSLFLTGATVGQMYALEDDWYLLRDRNDWILSPAGNLPEAQIVEINRPVEINGNFLMVRWAHGNNIQRDNPLVEMIDRRFIVGKGLKIRPWQPGDRFRPLGMKQEKKVSDFLTDVKMDRMTKNRQLVLTADDEIIWVCGQRLSDKARVTENTDTFAELSFQPAVR